MVWVFLRVVLLAGLLLAQGSFAERFVVYAFDPRVVAPVDVGLNMQVRRITSKAGHQVVIWHAAPRRGRPTVLYLHGNAGNLAMRHQRFAILLARGYGVVAPAYPGSSGSAGWPTQELLHDTIVEVYQRVTQGDFNGQSTRPVVYGESLGAAVALSVITDARAAPPLAVVLEAPFSRLADVGRHLGGWAGLLTPLLSSEWDSLATAPKLAAPLLVMHGTKDALIPIAQGRAVFEAASSPEKSFYALKGAGHTNLWQRHSQAHLFGWIDRQAAQAEGRVIHPTAVWRPRLPSLPPSR